MSEETNNGKDGGLLKGKPHYDKNGKPLGGIKAIVTDTGQHVELEGGEVIINKEASKKHWKELSKINQSAGGGVPIVNPNDAIADTEEYRYGGAVHGKKIEFNPNHLPNKWVYEYAKKIKTNYPKVWALGGNEFGDEAFNNLERALQRGYWTKNEEWMYVKWQSFNVRHKGDFRIAGVIANLKWLNKVDNGWDYMKNIIEKNIDKLYGSGTKLGTGGELKKGIEVEKEHIDTAEKLYTHKINPEQAPKSIAKEHPKYYTKLEEVESKFGLGGTADSSDDLSAPLIGGTLASSMALGGGIENETIKGITEVTYEDNGETLLYGQKNLKTKISVKNSSQKDIEDELNWEKKMLEKQKADLPNIIKANENIQNSLSSSLKEKDDSRKLLNMATKNIEILEKIVIPFYQSKITGRTNNANLGGGIEQNEKPIFDFMKSNPMGQARAITVLEKRINVDGKIMPFYKWIESFEKGLEVRTAKISSSKSEKGHVEKPVVGDHLVYSKAEQDYYVYLENGGEPYSTYLERKKIYDDAVSQKAKAERELKDAEREIENKKREESIKIAKNNEIKNYIENGKDFILKKRLSSWENEIKDLKSKRKSAETEKDIAFAERMIEQTIRLNDNAYKIATELYKIVDGNVVKKYDWKIGDKVLYDGKIETVIENIRENGLDKDATYVVEKRDGIYNQYISYDGLFPVKLEEINVDQPAEKEQYNYNKPLQRSDVDLVETFKNTDNTTQSIKFEYNGGFFEWRYSRFGSGSTINITKYSNLLQLKNPLSVSGKHETIYNTYNESQTTDLGRFLEFSISKWNKDDLFGKKPEPEQQKEPEKSFKERINVEKTAENFKDIRQSLDEFFTPKWTAQIMFDLAIKHGFKGGSILEPSFGHGVFFDVAIENSSKTELGIKEENLYGFEIYKPNFDVVKKNHPKAKLFDHNFEYQFIDKDIFFRKNKIEKSIDFKNKQFDLVLGNPPYGKHTSPHSFYFDNKMQIRYEGFFIWLALQKVKKGGLVVFIINSLWLQNGNLYNHQKEQIAKLGDLIDAYRLPNKTFKDTDIATDIVVFRKK